jgi:AmmeMemoRadiSam system protein B
MSAFGFYPEDRPTLEITVEKLLKSGKSYSARGVIVPHAGYQFSGDVAGNVFASARTDKRTFVIFGPNHTGFGSNASLSADQWKTPLGMAHTSKKLIENISKHIDIDESAHRREHSIEVQLPFLQILYKDFDFLPVSLKDMDFDELDRLSKLFGPDNFYIASSDFIHFGPSYSYMPFEKSSEENVNWVRQQDSKLIELICRLDAEKFYETVVTKGYTVCGVIPITLLMLVMKRIGAAKGHLVKYKTSYEIHPDSSFVSYAGIVFE